MSEMVSTLAGYVASDPRLFVSANGTAFTTFRMATTRRFVDRSTGQWVDGQTLWFTVKTWRETARNVAQSLRKGDAVVATGAVGMDEWDGPDGPRTSFVLEARNLGPDLSRGEARFARVVHRAAADGARADGAAGEQAPGVDGGSASGTSAGGSPGAADAAVVDPWSQDLAALTSEDAAPDDLEAADATA
jgi:single-strand DNA-binding protein